MAVLTAAVVPLLCLQAQQDRHGRGYKPPPPTAPVVVSVERASNGKPVPNVSVVFRAVENDTLSANLEMKTDPDGHASMDLLDVGSHVTVQVIADGFATYATDFDLPAQGKQVLVKLERPRAQVSIYGDDRDRPAQMQPGIQEHRPDAGKPHGAATPLQTTPPANPPATTAPRTPDSPGTPQ